MESVNPVEIGGNARKFLTSPRLAELKKEFEQNGGEWKEFKIGELFDIHPTKAYKLTNANLLNINGKTPVVSNTSLNNGIIGFSALPPTEQGNIITYSDTTTSDGIFYQPADFIGYPHIQGLYPHQKNKWFEKSQLYFVSLFRKSAAGRFDYANKFNRKTAAELTVTLPATPDGTPDFSYMERYIGELEQARVSELAAYLRAAGLENYDLTAAEQTALDDFKNNRLNFKEFKIEDLFDFLPAPYFGKIKRQLNVSKIRTNEFNLPLICAKKGNNGIMYYGRSTDFKSYKNVLSVVYNGVVAAGLVYAHNENIGIFTDSYLIKSKYDIAFKTNLFFKTVIEKCIYDKYSRELKAVWKRVKENIIFLPIKRNGTPDFAFMESFITAQQKLAIGDVVLWKDKVISETRKITKV